MSVKAVRMGRIPNSMKQMCSKSKENNHHESLQLLIKFNKLDCFKKIKLQNILPKSVSYDILNDNQIIILSLLRDKTYQLFKQNTMEYDSAEKRALQLIGSGYVRQKYEFTQEFTRLVKNKILEWKKIEDIKITNFIF